MNMRAMLPAGAFLVLCLPGCLLAGAAIGAGAVYAMSEDTARVDLRADRDAVFGVAVDVLEVRGTVEGTRPSDGEIEATVDGSKVTVRVFPVGGVTRVTVKARRLGGTVPNLSLAQDLAGAVGQAGP